MNSHSLYLDTKPSRLFFKAAIPGGISMLASSMYQIFDAIFVGKYLGTTAFAALGLVYPLIIVNFALSDLVGVGASVPISIALGRKEEDKANNYFTCACLLILFTSVLCGTLMYLLVPAYLRMMGADGELLELGVRFVRCYALFSPFVPILFSMDNFLRISGRPNISMWLNILSSVGILLLEPLLIVVLKMNIEGSAIACCSAMSICVIIGMSTFATGKLQLKFVRPRFHLDMLKHIYKNGTPIFLTNIAGRVFSVVINILLLQMGGEGAVAVYGVAITVCMLIEMLLYGVVDSLQPAIGYNFGAKRMDRVKAIVKYVLLAGAVTCFAGGGIIALFPQYLAIPFLEDLTLTPMAAAVLRISALAYVFKWISQVIQCLFTALERPLPAMSISVCNASIFPLLLIPILYPLELDGLWWNYPITSLLTTVLALILLLNYRKKLLLS